MLEQFLDVGIFHPSKIIEWYINHFWHCSNHAQYLPTLKIKWPFFSSVSLTFCPEKDLAMT
jgi:hypothetical protein